MTIMLWFNRMCRTCFNRCSCTVAKQMTWPTKSLLQQASCSSFVKFEPSVPTKKVWIGNLPRHTQESDLPKILGKFGTITETQIFTDKKQRCKGFAFVTFQQDADVIDAMRKSQSIEFDGRRLELRLALSKEQLRPEATINSMKTNERKWKKHVFNSVQICNRKANASKPVYVLSMFPYPSGSLHMGHCRVYTVSDTLARYYSLCGAHVIHPIGWDAFGLPAENAAVEKGILPQDWTDSNIRAMKDEFTDCAFGFDWHREISTCSPLYYRWTQYLFVLLFEHGLAYQKESAVNWDPIDKTVLADEQIDNEGRAWRSGAVVERKFLTQWFIRTSKFAKALLDGLGELPKWTDVANIQKSFIGNCDVYRLDLNLSSSGSATGNSSLDAKLELCLSNLDDLLTADKIVIKSDHPLCRKDVQETGGIDKRVSVGAKCPITGNIIPIFVDDFHQYAEGLSAGIIPTGNKEALHTPNQRIDPSSIGAYQTSARLSQDWIVSRQRKWGTPIPILHCETCGPVPVPKEDLPVTPSMLGLPARCPKCGSDSARRETDTLDTFFDSSWYFLRYLDYANEKVPFDPEIVKEYLPVNVYIGGSEHAVLHLYYARFMCHFLHQIGLLNVKEPFERLITQGIVKGRTYVLEDTGEFIDESRVVKPKSVEDGKKTLKDEKLMAMKERVLGLSLVQDSSGKLQLRFREVRMLGQNGVVHILQENCQILLQSLTTFLELWQEHRTTNDEIELIDRETGKKVKEIWAKMSKSKHNGVTLKETIDEYGVDVSRLLILSKYSPTSDIEWKTDRVPKFLSDLSHVQWVVSDFVLAKTFYPKVEDLAENTIEIAQKLEPLFEERYAAFLDDVNGNLNENECHLAKVLDACFAFANYMFKLPGEKQAIRDYDRAVFDLVICLHPFLPCFTSQLWAKLQAAPGLMNLSGVDLNMSVWDQWWPKKDRTER